MDRPQRTLLRLHEQFLGARSLFRMVRPLAEGPAQRPHRQPAVFYSPRAWVDERDNYVPDDWVRVERWPPPGTSPQRLYLCGDGSLSADCRGGASRTYRYDPHHPIPSLGGRHMLIHAGPRDPRPAQSLPPYRLIYRGEPLDADLTIAGAVRVTLHVESDCPDTDFIAKLIEVTPAGRAMLLMDGVMR